MPACALASGLVCRSHRGQGVSGRVCVSVAGFPALSGVYRERTAEKRPGKDPAVPGRGCVFPGPGSMINAEAIHHGREHSV